MPVGRTISDTNSLIEKPFPRLIFGVLVSLPSSALPPIKLTLDSSISKPLHSPVSGS